MQANQEEQFVYTPLAVDECRWYFVKAAISKGSKPYVQDIPGRGELLRLCDADSKACEHFYREHQQEIERAWWKEQAALFKGLTGGGSSPEPAGGPSSAKDQADEEPSSWEDFYTEERRDRPLLPVVRGGLFEVHVHKRRLQPCYWPGAKHSVLRGTWFVERSSGEWSPLRENLSDQLEEAFKGRVWDPRFKHAAQQPEGLVAARIELMTSDMKGLYALFAGPGDIYLCNDDSFSWLRRLSSTVPGARLRRGYVEPPAASSALAAEADIKQEEADEAAAATPPTSLVLFVHGIGQQLGAANIVADVTALRGTMRAAAAECLPDSVLASTRVEFLPVQWRKQLVFDVDKLASSIQPPGVRSLRQLAHATGVEVLLYMSAGHRRSILDSLADSLNCTYHRFLRRNQGFKGTVSLVAHSLGSVLTYDILCHQPMTTFPRELLMRGEEQQEEEGQQATAATWGADPVTQGSGSHGSRPATADGGPPVAEAVARPQAAAEMAAASGGGCAAPPDSQAEAGSVGGVTAAAAAAGQGSVEQGGSSVEPGGAADGSGGGSSPRGGGDGGCVQLPTDWAGPDSPVATPRDVIVIGSSSSDEEGEGGEAGPLAARQGKVAEERAQVVQAGDGFAAGTGLHDAEHSTGAAAAAASADGGGPAASPRRSAGLPPITSVRSYLRTQQGEGGAGQHTRQQQQQQEPTTAPVAADAGAAGGGTSSSGVRPQVSGGAPDWETNPFLLPTVPESSSADLIPGDARNGPYTNAGPATSAAIAGAAPSCVGAPLEHSSGQDADALAGMQLPPEVRRELDRLRSENARLALQLQTAQAERARLAARAFGESCGIGGGGDGGNGDDTAAVDTLAVVVGGGQGGGGSRLQDGEGRGQQQQQGRRPLMSRPSVPMGLHQPVVDIKALAFEVDKFIMIGSPLGLFLVLRGIDPTRGWGLGMPAAASLSPGPHRTIDGLPACNRWYNTYHPFDPIAYRVEPLVAASMEGHRPCFVPHKGGTRTHIALQEFSEGMTAAAGRFGASLLASVSMRRAVADANAQKQLPASALQPATVVAEAQQQLLAAQRAAGTQAGGAAAGRAAGGGGAVHGSGAEGYSSALLASEAQPDDFAPDYPSHASGGPEAQQQGQQQQGQQQQGVSGSGPAPSPSQQGRPQATSVWRLTDGQLGGEKPQGRLDFVLQEGMTENQYISALSAHFQYWSNPDVALFVLRAAMGLPVMGRWAQERQEQEAKDREAAKEAAREAAQAAKEAAQAEKEAAKAAAQAAKEAAKEAAQAAKAAAKDTAAAKSAKSLKAFKSNKGMQREGEEGESADLGGSAGAAASPRQIVRQAPPGVQLTPDVVAFLEN